MIDKITNSEHTKSMTAGKVTLGGAIALIKHTQLGKELKSLEDKGYVQKLYQRWQSLVNHQNQVESLLNAIPEEPCHDEKCHLADNEDFFVVYMLMYLPKAVNDNYCIGLVKHLNNCYRCFKVYSDVMRDYYHRAKTINEC